MKNKILFLAFMVVVSSCEMFRPLPVESNEEPPKLVINGVIDAQADEKLLVNISQTQPLVGDTNTIRWSDIYITDAIVLLFENEILLDTLQHSENGYYLPSYNFEPQIGAFYHIEVIHSDFENAATIPLKMPALPLVTAILREQSSIGNQDRIRYTIENEAEVDDFYEMEVLTEEDSSGVLESAYISFGGSDYDLEDPSCGLGQAIFSDVCFDGEAFTQEIQVVNTRVTRMIFNLSAVSESYFKHFQNQQSNNVDEITQIFTEPATYYTNVENGYGVFYVRNILSIEL